MKFVSQFVLALALVSGSSAIAAPVAPNQAPVTRVERLTAQKIIIYYDIATADGPAVVIQGLESVIDHCVKSAMMAVADPQTFVFGFGLMNRTGLIENGGERSGIFNAGDAGGCWVTRKKPSVDDGIPPA